MSNDQSVRFEISESIFTKWLMINITFRFCWIKVNYISLWKWFSKLAFLPHLFNITERALNANIGMKFKTC